jgi:hypothetical protein
MRNISFSLTTKQFRDRSKTVTRRLRWINVKAGDLLMGVEKAMGLKPGEKIKKLGPIRVTDARNEPLQRMIDEPEYGAIEAAKEGFPDLSGAEFVTMFCRHMKCNPSFAPKRIEYEYIDEVTSQFPCTEASE